MSRSFFGKTISLCPASFCIPRPNLPVTPGVSLLSPFDFQSPIMKRTFFGGVSSRRFCRSSQNHSTSASSVLLVGAQTCITVILNGLFWKQREIILQFFLRLHPSTAFQTVLLTVMATPFPLRDSCPQLQIQWSPEVNSVIPVNLSLLIPKMLTFTLAISCLTTSNLPCFMDLTFQWQGEAARHWSGLWPRGDTPCPRSEKPQ